MQPAHEALFLNLSKTAEGCVITTLGANFSTQHSPNSVLQVLTAKAALKSFCLFAMKVSSTLFSQPACPVLARSPGLTASVSQRSPATLANGKNRSQAPTTRKAKYRLSFATYFGAKPARSFAPSERARLAAGCLTRRSGSTQPQLNRG